MKLQTQQPLTFEIVWQMFKETDKKFQETAKQLQETKTLINDIGRKYGGLSNNIGEAGEEFFFRGFENNPVIGKIRFDKIVRNMKTDDAEYDIVLTNGNYVSVNEVKHKFHTESLAKFISKKIPAFRKEFPKFKNCKIIAGIAGFVIPEKVKVKANRAGLYVFTQ